MYRNNNHQIQQKLTGSYSTDSLNSFTLKSSSINNTNKIIKTSTNHLDSNKKIKTTTTNISTSTKQLTTNTKSLMNRKELTNSRNSLSMDKQNVQINKKSNQVDIGQNESDKKKFYSPNSFTDQFYRRNTMILSKMNNFNKLSKSTISLDNSRNELNETIHRSDIYKKSLPSIR